MAVEKRGEDKTTRETDPDPKAERMGIREDPSQSTRFWRQAATMLGLIWNLVIPIVGGVLLGSYLGMRLGHSEAWTAGLLAVGVAVSLYNLYRFLFEGMIG